MARNVELLLVDNVDNLGIVGDVVAVRPGYARNYLLPRGLATVPTERAKAAVAERRAQVQRELAELRRQHEAMIQKLEGFELTLERSCNDQGFLYGSVTQHDIAEGLRREGFDRMQDRYVRIGTPIKRIDSYPIPIQIDSELKTEIKLWVVSDRPLPEEESTEATEESAAAEAQPPAATGEGA